MSWLADGLAKLQLFTRPGVVFWTILTATVQVVSGYLFASMYLVVFPFPLKISFVAIYATRGAFFICSPIAIYFIGKFSPAFLNTKDACVPKYWYLLLLSQLLAFAYQVINMILYWDNSINSLAFEIFNLVLILIFGSVFGIATATFVKSCNIFCFESNGNLVKNGKSILENYRILKKTSQLAMLAVLLLMTANFILTVSL